VTVNQQTLAALIGTTRSRVNVFMNKFRKLGLIKYNGKRPSRRVWQIEKPRSLFYHANSRTSTRTVCSGSAGSREQVLRNTSWKTCRYC
jgi:hypothetical protein